MKRLARSAAMACLVLAALSLHADGDAAEETPPPTVSTITIGGMVTGVSSYAHFAYGWHRGRLGLTAELYNEFTFRRWTDGTRDRYYYAGLIAGFRASVLPGGRGVFGELGVGGGYAVLTTVDGAQTRRTGDFNIVGTPRVGIRFGDERGLYGETAIRALFPLREIYLTTESSEPEGSRDAEVSKHAWHLPSVRPLTRFYIGFGYTF